MFEYFSVFLHFCLDLEWKQIVLDPGKRSGTNRKEPTLSPTRISPIPPPSPVKNYPHPGVPVITCENSASHSALAWLEELADSEESGGCWDLGSNISLLLSLQQGSNVVFLQIRAVDPHSLYTDPDTDPDPAVFLNADPDPDPGPGLA